MTQKLREQISALADHELPEGEHELLLRRFAVEKSLRLHWERYHLIGEAMRKGLPAVDTRGFADRVMAVLSDEPTPAAQPPRFTDRLLRGFAGLAVAASVTVVAIIGLKHDTNPGSMARGEIVPINVVNGETSPVSLMNDASWSGGQMPVQASLDGALIDQEGETSALGMHGLPAHRHLNRPAQDAPADTTVQGPAKRKPPRQY